MKKLTKLFVIGAVFVTGIALFCLLMGYRLTPTSTLPGDVQIVMSEKTPYGKAVLFEDLVSHTFGVAQVEQFLRVFYRFNGGSSSPFTEEGRPFLATGIAHGAKSADSFLVGVRTAPESTISYIALGNHMQGLTPSVPYQLTLDEVKANPNQYHMAEVNNNYAFILADEYTEDNWTIRAFDKEGYLIADKLFGADIRRMEPRK